MARKSGRKERITVSLSRESARFLRTFRSKSKIPSMSALFEKMIGDVQARSESEELNEKIKAYYDNLSPAEIQENSAWGKLGEAALASLSAEEESLVRAQESSRPRRQVAHRER